MKHEKISIIMGIYNCEETLDEAIGSILAQTYPNWTLIMCDDGSGDRTYEIARKYAEQDPERFRLLRNERNMGLNHTLNRCLAAAEGPYIARMDGDDRSHPERLERELAFLEAHPDYALVSCGMEYFDENGVWGACHPIPEPAPLDFVSGSPFCHAPVLMRAEALRAVGGYTEEKRLLRVEDYHLWMKFYEKGCRGANLPEALYQMRDDRNAASRRKYRYRLNECYVRCLVVTRLHLPKRKLIYALRPLIVGLLPKPIYEKLHQARLRANSEKETPT